jgi:hypothetical protein
MPFGVTEGRKCVVVIVVKRKSQNGSCPVAVKVETVAARMQRSNYVARILHSARGIKLLPPGSRCGWRYVLVGAHERPRPLKHSE